MLTGGAQPRPLRLLSDMRKGSKLPGLWAKRVRLRNLRAGDEEFLAKLDSNPEVMRYIHAGALDFGQALRWGQMQVESATEKRSWPRRWGKWIVQTRQNAQVVGWVELSKFSTSHGDYLCVGYQFAPEFWNAGYATEAVRTAVRYALRWLKYRYVYAYAQPANLASVRVLEKVGFEKTKRTIRDDGRNNCAVFRVTKRMFTA